MLIKPVLVAAVAFCLAFSCVAADKPESKPESKPVELEMLKGFVGTWDAEIEVWPTGLDSPSIKMKGVEKNRPFGEHWVASDFVSEYEGQKVKVHSVVGYDLDKKQLVGTMVDHGPYAATMAGKYDKKSKTVKWMIHAKMPDGTPMVQKSSITQTNANERVLVMMMPGKKKGELTKFMEIRFVKRKK